MGWKKKVIILIKMIKMSLIFNVILKLVVEFLGVKWALSQEFPLLPVIVHLVLNKLPVSFTKYMP